MKKKSLLRVVLLAMLSIQFSIALAQAPKSMSYQAVIRDANNSLITNASVTMRISILKGSIHDSAVYIETQRIKTNINGLVTLAIGKGTIVKGSFPGIDWAKGPYFVKTETDPGAGKNYTITGTSQLLSVPYALYAATSGSSLSTLSSDSLPPGWINLHDAKYSTPTDGTITGGGTDATSAIMTALADVPLGGTLLMGPYIYVISGAKGIDLSSRLDVHFEGSGGGMAGNHSNYDGTYIKVTGTNNAFTIDPTTQGQQGPSFSKIHVYDGSGQSTGWYVHNCNKSHWDRCSVKYADKGWVFSATNGAGWDNAWHTLYDITSYQCNYGICMQGNFGISVFGADIQVPNNSARGLFFSNYAQNNKFYNLMIDGTTGGSVGNGIGIEVDSTGAHDNEFFGLKAEALSTTVKLRSPGGGSTPTRSIKFFGGSMSGFAGTEQMIDIGSNVDRTVIDNVGFPNSNTYALMVSDSGTNTRWTYPDDYALFTETYAASYTPSNLHLGQTKVVTMSGNITSIASMPGAYKGAQCRIIFVQDATGGRTLPAAASWTGYYMHTISNTNNTALKRTVFEFEYDGTNWIQVSAANTWF